MPGNETNYLLSQFFKRYTLLCTFVKLHNPQTWIHDNSCVSFAYHIILVLIGDYTGVGKWISDQNNIQLLFVGWCNSTRSQWPDYLSYIPEIILDKELQISLHDISLYTVHHCYYIILIYMENLGSKITLSTQKITWTPYFLVPKMHALSLHTVLPKLI